MRDEKIKLEKQLACFPIRKRDVKRWTWLIAGVILVLVSIGLLLFFSLKGWTAIENHGRAVVLRFLPYVLPLLMVVFPAGVMLIIFARLHWWDAVTVYENGLLIKKGYRMVIMHWSEIEQFDTRVTNINFAGNAVNTRIKLILKPRNKRPRIIKNKYRHMSELIRLIRAHSLPILTKSAQDQIEKGQEIHFHKELIATKNGLRVNGNVLNWTEFQKPKVKNRILSLKDKDSEEELFKANINRIENLDLLLTLMANPPSPNPSTSEKQNITM